MKIQAFSRPSDGWALVRPSQTAMALNRTCTSYIHASRAFIFTLYPRMPLWMFTVNTRKSIE